MGSAEVGDADEPATAITTLTVSSGASTQARASASGSRRQWRYLPGQSRPAGLVWSVWALLSITLIAYVARYGHNVPYYDEWGLAWVLHGRQPLDAGWLWQQVNDHRIPFPKLILVGLLSVFGWDFRAGMFFDALALIVLAALLVRTASQVRGRA